MEPTLLHRTLFGPNAAAFEATWTLAPKWGLLGNYGGDFDGRFWLFLRKRK